MANKAYAAIALTGGGTGALDTIDGAGLVDGDLALVVDAANNLVHFYTLNSSVGGASNSPTLIPPVLNAGTKRWELVKIYAKDSIGLTDGTNIGLLQFSTNILELYNQKHSGSVRVSVEDAGGNKETVLLATGGGGIELYYDNSKKLEVTNTGITVTGEILVGTDAVPHYAGSPAAGNQLTHDGSAWVLGASSKYISITRDLSAATGNVSYTGIGFKPTGLICFGTVDGVENVFSAGLYGGGSGAGIALMDLTVPSWNLISTIISIVTNAAGTDSQGATLASFDADGFTLSWTKGGTPVGTATIRILCLR